MIPRNGMPLDERLHAIVHSIGLDPLVRCKASLRLATFPSEQQDFEAENRRAVPQSLHTMPVRGPARFWCHKVHAHWG